MPIKEPAKVSISPKAMSTEWCISANGGRTKPAVSIMQPKLHSVSAVINWIFFFIGSVYYLLWRTRQEKIVRM